MRRLGAALIILLGLANAALAQSTFTMPPPAGVFLGGFQVVTSCGAASLSNGNLAFGSMDTTGKICTNASGGGGGGLSVTDQATFTQGSSSFTPGGGVFNDAATLSSGQQGAYRLTTKRAQVVDIDTSGNALYSALTSPIPTQSATVSIGGVGLVNGGAVGSTGSATPSSGVLMGYSSGGNLTAWDKSVTVSAGTNRVGYTSDDPCTQKTKTNKAFTTNGTSSVELVAVSGSTTIYVCSISMIAAGATTVAFTTGTGTACATGNAAVIGSTTANIANSMSFPANGGMTLGNGTGTVAQGAASSAFCMVNGTNVYVSGNISYVQQ